MMKGIFHLSKYRSNAFLPAFKTFSRNLFMVSLTYKVPLTQVDAHLKEHRSFLEKYRDEKIFILAGRKEPRTGGFIIASVKSQHDLESILEQDPFKKHGIADYIITKFTPSIYSEQLSKIVEADQKISSQKP